MGSYLASVAGEGQRNKDGRSRQEIIERCMPGQPILAFEEPDNPYDPDAIRLDTADGQTIGYVPRGESWVRDALANRASIAFFINNVTGTKGRRGVTLLVLTGRDVPEDCLAPLPLARLSRIAAERPDRQPTRAKAASGRKSKPVTAGLGKLLFGLLAGKKRRR